MNNLDRQLKRIGKIHHEARGSLEYKIESAKIRYTEQISERLEALGLTRTDLADRMGVSAPYITKILRGTANLTLDSMVKIADAVDCKFIPEARPREHIATVGHSLVRLAQIDPPETSFNQNEPSRPHKGPRRGHPPTDGRKKTSP